MPSVPPLRIAVTVAFAAVAAFTPVAAPAQRPPEPSPELAAIAAAYAAKIAASAVFVSGRSLESVQTEELAPDRPLEALIGPLLRFEVDREQRAVTCRLGAATATAVATANLGCTLVRPDAPAAMLHARAAPEAGAPRPDAAAVEFPLGERVPSAAPEGVDLAALRAAVDAAFAEPEGKPKVRTRAVVVVHRGRLVAERYGDGYTATMPLPGWSMTKVVVSALVGVRAGQGKLDLDAVAAVPEWRTEGDPRGALRLHELLTMTTGLAWREDYDDPGSDALRMLFASSDHGAVQATRPLEPERRGRYRYSSGTTNLVCRVLRGTFADDREYWAFPRQALFARLRMDSALVETDPSGTFVGSSYGFATARDWARFGMLWAQDGVFAGERILPEGWVAESVRAASASGGRFGRHVWCNIDPDGEGPRTRPWPDLPADLLRMDGHEGQYVVALPAQQLVVVRLGCSKRGGFDLRGLIRAALRACGA